MRAVTKLETKTIQHLLEIFYFIAVPFNPEYESTRIKVSLKTVENNANDFEYLLYRSTSTFHGLSIALLKRSEMTVASRDFYSCSQRT